MWKIFLPLVVSTICMAEDACVVSADQTEQRIIIVAASYNNAQWYKIHLRSIFSQKYHNFHLIYIDDCSLDGTAIRVQEYVTKHGVEQQVTLIRNKSRQGALANQYKAIHSCNDRDIIIILDADDWFAHDKVLETINNLYQTGGVWLTYGQYVEFPLKKTGLCEPTLEEYIETNTCRYYASGFSHLRTFYAGLYKQIKIEDLLHNGKFYPVNADMATMLPMVEMAGYHIRFIPEVLMIYNKANNLNDHKVNLPLVDKCGKEIRARTPYEKIISPFGTHVTIKSTVFF